MVIIGVIVQFHLWNLGVWDILKLMAEKADRKVSIANHIFCITGS